MGELQYEITNGVLKAHINPENDLSDIQEVLNVVETHSEVVLIGIDMYKCSYIQSRFLASLVAVKKLAMARKITIELLNINDQIAQVLQSTNQQKLFVIKDDYSSYPLEALCEKFYDTEKAEVVCEYLSANYDDDIRNKLIEIVNGGNPILVEYAILTMGRAQDYDNIEITAKVILDTLASETASLDSEQQKALYEGVYADYDNIKTKRKRNNAVREDPYYNALQIKYSAAITCHKSQGGEWKCVFIDNSFYRDEISLEDLKWLYTAITRAVEKVYFVNFPDSFFV